MNSEFPRRPWALGAVRRLVQSLLLTPSGTHEAAEPAGVSKSGGGPRCCTSNKLLCEETREGHLSSCEDGQTRRAQRSGGGGSPHMLGAERVGREHPGNIERSRGTDHPRVSRFTAVPSLNWPLLVPPILVPHILCWRESLHSCSPGVNELRSWPAHWPVHLSDRGTALQTCTVSSMWSFANPR